MRANVSRSKQKPTTPLDRVIGFDNHPDPFTASFLIASEGAKAKVLKTQDRIPQQKLEQWLKEETTERDVIVIEASANTFAVVELAEALGRRAIVLESQQCGRIGDAYCVTDRVSAIKLARIYLSGLSKRVWAPDEKTKLWREIFYAYAQAVTDSTATLERSWACLLGRLESSPC